MVAGPSAPLVRGRVVAGKYRVDGVLGEGGMGVVYAARHLVLGQDVALKLLLDHRANGDASAAARFLAEARHAASIDSEHVCRVLDAGTLDDGALYIVMERLVGSDLAALLERKGPLGEATVVGYALEALEALAQAHRRGIVHRDLKPSNLFLAKRTDRAAIVKVLDFGIAKADNAPGVSTTTGAVVGSPAYMAPEQIRGERVDPRTDIWALGVVMYELASGVHPFYDRASPNAVLSNILDRRLRPLRDVAPNASRGLERVVDQCLASARADRYADVLALARALAPLGKPAAAESVERVARALAARDPSASTDAGLGGAARVGLADATTLDRRDAFGTTAGWSNDRGDPAARRRVAWARARIAAAIVVASALAAGVVVRARWASSHDAPSPSSAAAPASGSATSRPAATASPSETPAATTASAGALPTTTPTTAMSPMTPTPTATTATVTRSPAPAPARRSAKASAAAPTSPAAKATTDSTTTTAPGPAPLGDPLRGPRDPVTPP